MGPPRSRETSCDGDCANLRGGRFFPRFRRWTWYSGPAPTRITAPSTSWPATSTHGDTLSSRNSYSLGDDLGHHSGLPVHRVAVSVALPLHSELIDLCARRGTPSRCAQGILARRSP